MTFLHLHLRVFTTSEPHHFLFCQSLFSYDHFAPTLEGSHHYLRVPTTFYSAFLFHCDLFALTIVYTYTWGSPPLFSLFFYSATTFLHLHLRFPITFCFVFFIWHFYSAMTFLHLHLRVLTTWGSPTTFYSAHFYSGFLFYCNLFVLTLEGPDHLLFHLFILLWSFLHLHLRSPHTLLHQFLFRQLLFH